MKVRVHTVAKMKLLLVLFSVILAACADSSADSVVEDPPIWKDYHQEFGIAEATRIRIAEEAADFDGSRIVGGSASRVGQHRHFAGLIVVLTSGGQSVCGASILSETRCLTAAHCWRHGNSQGRTLTVVMGSDRLFSGGTRVNSNTVHMHGSYNQNNLNNDIAMINMNRVNFNNNINRINIATGNNQFVGTRATAAGFGRQGDNQGIGNNQGLRHVVMPVINNQQCAAVYGTSVVNAAVLCTATTGGRGTCQGDSGGPLYTGTTLMGVTSFVHRNGCSAGQPAGFARVTSHVNWIRGRL